VYASGKVDFRVTAEEATVFVGKVCRRAAGTGMAAVIGYGNAFSGAAYAGGDVIADRNQISASFR